MNSIKRGHIFRRYLHIEAVFVFGGRLDHLSARQAGWPFRVAHVA
jgi:hypothetical protein